MIFIPESEYAILFIVILLVWPLAFINFPVILAIFFIVNIAILAIVIHFTSSNILSFWEGLKLLPRKYMSGCGNITLMYIFFVLMFHYFGMVKATFIGISRGKEYTQNWWIRHVKKHTGLSINELVNLGFYEKKISLKELILKMSFYIIAGLLPTVIMTLFIL